MSRQPAVSVLVPCYNKRDYVEETLQSVYDQAHDDWEIIAVDDGSTDDSRRVLERHADRLRLIRQDNQGASAARERALADARGRYIQYLDADDLLLPNALADRVAALEETGVDVAYSDWQELVRDETGFRRGDVTAQRMEDVDPDPELACFGGFWSPPAALLFARSIVERIRWNAALPVIQDARYLLDAALAGARFVHVPGVSALYRGDTRDSLSRRSRRAFAADVFENAEQVLRVWEARGTLTPRHRRALARAYGYVAREAFRHDTERFAACVARLRALDDAPRQRWPYAAALARQVLGHRGALGALRMIGRPAP